MLFEKSTCSAPSKSLSFYSLHPTYCCYTSSQNAEKESHGPTQSIFQIGDEGEKREEHVFLIHWAEKWSTDCHAESETEAQVAQIGLLTPHSCPGYSKHPSLTSHDAQ